jgi:hypothetical protein
VSGLLWLFFATAAVQFAKDSGFQTNNAIVTDKPPYLRQ